MAPQNLADARWRKSSRSNSGGGGCVEVAPVARRVAVRDSKNPTGPALAFTPDAWHTFLTGIRTGTYGQP